DDAFMHHHLQSAVAARPLGAARAERTGDAIHVADADVCAAERMRMRAPDADEQRDRQRRFHDTSARLSRWINSASPGMPSRAAISSVFAPITRNASAEA